MNALIVYFSKYGQTQKIAHRIADTISASGQNVQLRDAHECQKLDDLGAFDLIILGSPIYVTKHSKQLGKFIKRHREELAQMITAFFSVSLSAAGPDEQRQEARNAMIQFLKNCSWQPTRTTIFAGNLPYRQYGWITRFIMKRIVRKSGGDTDTSRNYEYTDWKRVEQFAMVCALAAKPKPTQTMELERPPLSPTKL